MLTTNQAMTNSFGPQSLLASVTVVARALPPLSCLPHVTTTINAFADVTANWDIIHAAKFDSLRLLYRVAAQQAIRWTTLGPNLVKAYKQQHFVDAMNIMATRGFLVGARWLHEVYFQEGKVKFPAQQAADHGHAAFLDWLIDTFGDEIEFNTMGLLHAVNHGDVDVLRVVMEKSRHFHFELHEIDRYSAYATSLPIVHFLHNNYPEFDSRPVMRTAAKHGNLDMMLWLHKHRAEKFTPDVFQAAVLGGQLHVAQYLRTYHADITAMSNRYMNIASAKGFVDILDWIYMNRTEDFIPNGGIFHRPILLIWGQEQNADGHWEVCKWLHAHRYNCEPEFIQMAAIAGNLPMLEWLFIHYRHVFESNLEVLDVDGAASRGYLEVIKWLDSKGLQFTIEAVNSAAKNGHLSVIQYFHSHWPQLFTSQAMDNAAAGGALEIVKFLHDHRREGCTTDAMDLAANRNDMEMVKFLHENRTEGCTTWAMDNAEHVEMLQYLHKHRTEGCSVDASMIAVWGRLEVLEWFYQHKRNMIDLERAREVATEYHILYWLDAIEAGEV